MWRVICYLKAPNADDAPSRLVLQAFDSEAKRQATFQPILEPREKKEDVVGQTLPMDTKLTRAVI